MNNKKYISIIEILADPTDKQNFCIETRYSIEDTIDLLRVLVSDYDSKNKHLCIEKVSNVGA